ncbi:MAG: dTMP kinase [Proteobacteria bacterium]|nr:dTMP kinase [Pseudomonadota bacterium]
MSRGRFITLEGGEGAGKSTQVRRLAAWLEGRGIEAITTREPGGSPGAEAIRTLLVDGATDRWDAVTETMLHFAARRDHLRVTVLPALERGAWVVSDRFADSTRAYQGIVQGAGDDLVERLYAIAVGELRPDLTLVLDLPVEKGLARATERGGENRYERMGRAFHERLRLAFLDIAAADPQRCVVVDADDGPDAVAGRIASVVAERLS